MSFMLAATAAWFLATRAADHIERETATQAETALQAAGQSWATVRPDGLLLHVSGVAPDEAARLRALDVLGQVIDSRRVVDKTSVSQAKGISEPRFSLEILRNLDRISLIGLLPSREEREAILLRAREIAAGGEVTDMLESAEHPIPPGWERNIRFGLESLARLPRAKISVTPEEVRVTAVTESQEEKEKVVRSLTRAKPQETRLVMDISAPRPVISPFTFRMRIEGGKARLDACSADTRASRDRILRAVAEAGLKGPAFCRIGLGVPTADWDRAVIRSISALRELGGGTLTLTDSDISLIAPESASQELFDRVVGRLEAELPELFSLQAILPPKILKEGEEATVEVPEFVATRSPEGQVRLSGRVPNPLVRESVGAYAVALFGSERVANQTRVDENLPDGWTARVLAALDALAELHHGAATVQPRLVEIRGTGADPEVSSEIARILAEKLEDPEAYRIDVEHDPKLLPRAETVDAQIAARACEKQIQAVLDARQIAFAPGSAEIEADSQGVIDEIAEILKGCPDTAFEIEGHTDSQGREEMNLALSQSRADAVLAALLERRVLISRMVARGYGETRPIADNSTEEGRAANRRIAFRLLDAVASSEEEGTEAGGAEAEAAPSEPAQAETGADAAEEETPATAGEETDGQD